MARGGTRHIGDAQAAFTGADMSTKLKLAGYAWPALATPAGKTPHSRSCQYVDERRQVYKKIVISEDGKLLGVVLIGDAAEYGTAAQMAPQRHHPARRPRVPDLPSSDGASSPAWAWMRCPTRRRSVRATTSPGATSAKLWVTAPAPLSPTSRPAPGGRHLRRLRTLVTQVMKAEMARQGLAVNNHLCEHFAAVFRRLPPGARGPDKTFDDLLACHGSGMGRDICVFSVAASVFASCNEFVLKRDSPCGTATITYLGNIQKDGTYSVAPARLAAKSHRQPDRCGPGSQILPLGTTPSQAVRAWTCSSAQWNSCR